MNEGKQNSPPSQGDTPFVQLMAAVSRKDQEAVRALLQEHSFPLSDIRCMQGLIAGTDPNDVIFKLLSETIENAKKSMLGYSQTSLQSLSQGKDKPTGRGGMSQRVRFYRDGNTPFAKLMVAVAHNQQETVHELSQKNAFTAEEIIQAVEKAVSVEAPDIVMVTILLGKAKFSVENFRHFFFTIIQSVYINQNHTYIIQLFLNYAKIINETDPLTGMTALQLASKLGKYTVADLLLQNKANISVRNKKGRNFSALDYAAVYGHTEIVDRLLQYSQEKLNVTTALYLAAEEGNVKMAEMLLRYDPSAVNQPCESCGVPALHSASAAGNADMVKLLLDYGADIMSKHSKDEATPLDRAADNGQIAAIEVMLSYRERTIHLPPLRLALRMAAQNNHMAVVRRLLEYQPDLIKEPSLALHSSINKNHTEMACFLIDKGAKLDEQNEFGWTPLCIAAMRGNKTIVCLLLERGVDISLFFPEKNPWEVALQGGHTEVVEILEKEYEEKGLNKNEVAVFYIAMRKGDSNSVSILLKGSYLTINGLLNKLSLYGAIGTTPLHVAAEAGHVGVIKQFLERLPESVNIVDKFGRTALHIAAQKGNADIVVTLLNHGANPEQVQDSKVAEDILRHSENSGMALITQYFSAKLKQKWLTPLPGRITAFEIAQTLKHQTVIEAFWAFEKENILKLLLPVFDLSKISPDLVKFKIGTKAVELFFQSPQKAQIFFKRLCFYFRGVMAADLNKDTLSLLLPIVIEEKKGSNTENSEKAISTFNDFLRNRLGFSRWSMVSFKINQDEASYGIQYYGGKQELRKLEAAIATINESGLAEIDIGKKTAESIQLIFPAFFFENLAKNGALMEAINKLLVPEYEVPKKQEVVVPDTYEEAIKHREEELAEQLRLQEIKQKEKQYREQALREAVKNGLLGKVQELLDQAVNVNAPDQAGLTALHWAAQSYLPKMVTLLVAAGADVKAEDNAGRTALHWAVRSNFADMIIVLIESGAEVNAKNKAGNTPLHSAAALLSVDAIVVETLIAMPGINLAITNNEGQTAREVAASKRREEIVAILSPTAAKAPDVDSSRQAAGEALNLVVTSAAEQKPDGRSSQQTVSHTGSKANHEADERHHNPAYVDIALVKKDADLSVLRAKGKKKIKSNVKEIPLISGMVGLKDACDQLETLVKKGCRNEMDFSMWNELESLLESGGSLGGWDLAMYRYIVQGITQILALVKHRQELLGLQAGYQQLILLRHRLVHNRLSDDMSSTELVFYNQRALMAMAQAIREFKVQDNSVQFCSSINKLLKTFKQQQPYSVSIEGNPYKNYLSCIRVNLLRLKENLQTLFAKCEKRNLSPGTVFLSGLDLLLISAIHAAIYQIGEAYAKFRLLLRQHYPEDPAILPFNKVVTDFLERCKEARNREWHEADDSGKQEIACVHEANRPGKMWELALELNRHHEWLIQALLTCPIPAFPSNNPSVPSSNSASSSSSMSGLGGKAAMFPTPNHKQTKTASTTLLEGTKSLSK